MTVQLVATVQRFQGLSTDTKPTVAPVGSEFVETNTSARYVWDGTSWLGIAAGSYIKAHGTRVHSVATIAAVNPAVATLLLAANAARKVAMLVNNGTTAIYLAKANTVTAATGTPLGPGASLTDEYSTEAWWGIVGNNEAGDIRVVEVA